jgi:hypothetical protein
VIPDAVKAEILKWLPIEEDGQLQGAKEVFRALMVAFAFMWVARMFGANFSKLDLWGISIDPSLPWWYFMCCTLLCASIMQRLGYAQKEREAVRNGTIPPPAPGKPELPESGGS